MPLTVTMYRANDGSVHATEKDALRYNKYLKERDRENCLIPTIEKYLNSCHFTCLTQSITPYNNSKWDDFQWERETFAREVASMLLTEWDNIKALVEDESS